MPNSKQRMNVTDLISFDEIQKWQDGDVITISAGTGVGKSYFVKNRLFSSAKEDGKKILMLIHRINCVNQFKEEIKRDGKERYIDIMTYQGIESRELNNCNLDMSIYKYIVCDEFHYFIDDAKFNKTTDISFNNIIKQNNAIRIFMSATGDSMKRYIRNRLKINTIDYDIPLDFSFIDTLTFINKDSTLEYFANKAIETEEKVILFIQSAEKAYKLYKKFKDNAMFVCGADSKYNKYVDDDKLKSMLSNEKFEELILITTSCLDAGVNIIDDKLKHIVIDIIDIGSLIQCMGRKRVKENEKVNIYIKAITNQQLGGFETYTKKIVKMADYLRLHNTSKYIEKYPREYDKSNIVYDECTANGYEKKVNELMYFKRKFDIFEYNEMKRLGKFGYCKYLAIKFGFYDSELDEFLYRTIKEDNGLEAYLNSIVDRELLNVPDRRELTEKINIRRDGKLIKKLESINPTLLELGFKFQIKEMCINKIIDGKRKKYRSVWIVEKI